MSNEHTTWAELRPDMTLAELMGALVRHFQKSETDSAEFEVNGLDSGKPIQLAFSIKLRSVQ